MRTVSINDFCKHIAPQAENCPDFLIRQQVANTVKDLCEQTGCLTVHSEFTTEADKVSYDIPLPAGLDVEVVRFCYVDGRAVRPTPLDLLERQNGEFDWQMSSGAPLVYSFRKHGRILFSPVPDDAYNVRLELTATIDRDSDMLPEIFYDHYLDAVVVGTLARIFRVAGQTYTNVRLADQYDMRYAMAVADIRTDVARDFTRTTGRMAFNRII